MMNLETLDLRDVIGDMVKLLRRLIGENVELSTVWPDMPTLVRADKAQVEQVIANLAVNATAAMPDGGHLAIEVVQDDDRRQVLLIVRDDGTGMDALTAAQIFEPFFTTKGTDGTGSASRPSTGSSPRAAARSRSTVVPAEGRRSRSACPSSTRSISPRTKSLRRRRLSAASRRSCSPRTTPWSPEQLPGCSSTTATG